MHTVDCILDSLMLKSSTNIIQLYTLQTERKNGIEQIYFGSNVYFTISVGHFYLAWCHMIFRISWETHSSDGRSLFSSSNGAICSRGFIMGNASDDNDNVVSVPRTKWNASLANGSNDGAHTHKSAQL